MEGQTDNALMPEWQRFVCGALAVTGLGVYPIIAWSLFQGDAPPLRALIVLGGAGFGYFLFGFAAIKGRLPHFMVRPRHGSRQT